MNAAVFLLICALIGYLIAGGLGALVAVLIGLVILYAPSRLP